MSILEDENKQKKEIWAHIRVYVLNNCIKYDVKAKDLVETETGYEFKDDKGRKVVIKNAPVIVKFDEQEFEDCYEYN